MRTISRQMRLRFLSLLLCGGMNISISNWGLCSAISRWREKFSAITHGDQSINQSINQSIDERIQRHQSINQSIDHQRMIFRWSINQSIHRWAHPTYSINQSINHQGMIFTWSINQSMVLCLVIQSLYLRTLLQSILYCGDREWEKKIAGINFSDPK